MLCKLAPNAMPRGRRRSPKTTRKHFDGDASHDVADFIMKFRFIISLQSMLMCLTSPDLHGNPLPTPDPSRLSPYLLRLVFEGLVQFPADPVAQLSKLPSSGLDSIYLPIMSRAGTRYEAQCDGDYVVGDVRGCQPGQG